MSDGKTCDPLDLNSHDWQPFAKRPNTLLKCARAGCGLVVPTALFKLTGAHLP